MNNKIKLKKGDEVIVLAGKDKGKTGKISIIQPFLNKAIVSGINKVKKHQKPDNNQAGGIVEKEASLHVSNVMVLQGGNASKLGYKVLEDGSKIRILKKTNEESEIQWAVRKI